MSTDSKTGPHPNPDFAEFITDLDHGKINQRLTEQLAMVTDAVEDTGLCGELTVKFSVKKEGKMAIVTVDSKYKKPEHPMHGTLFYFGNNGGLLREDPKQLKLKGLAQPALKVAGGEESDND